LKKSVQYAQLKEAMELIGELKVPEHLQDTALAHLLSSVPTPAKAAPAAGASHQAGANANGATMAGGPVLEFIAKHKPKGAVEEIPALLYWARENEKATEWNETDIIQLYRRADIKPPKNVGQSMRDLSSKKKYGRLDAVTAKVGYVTLSRVGEDFILHNLFKRNAR
jgi:hypothetical protein